MIVSDLIGPERIVLDVRVRDKTHLLRDLGLRAASATGINADAIARGLSEREQLGSTGVGQGIALPHARIDGLKSYFGLFVRLTRPIPFQAIDDQTVDLVFLLLIPANSDVDHVAALAAISRKMRERGVADQLRKAATSNAAFQLLAQP